MDGPGQVMSSDIGIYFLSSEAGQLPFHLLCVGTMLADDMTKSTLWMKGRQFFCSSDSLGNAKLALGCGNEEN